MPNSTQPPSPAPRSGSYELHNRREEIDRAEGDLLAALAACGYAEAAIFAVRLAMEEGLVNAFKHGHKLLPAETPVSFSYQADVQGVRLDIVDRGPGFNPADVPDPTLEENLDKPCGRGLLLMRAYMTKLEYLGKGNHLRMSFARVQAKP